MNYVRVRSFNDNETWYISFQKFESEMVYLFLIARAGPVVICEF